MALNCAFDRSELRFGDDEAGILRSIARGVKGLSARARIRYFSHQPTDERMIPVLEAEGVPFELVALYREDERAILDAYQGADVVFGMRGHSQMIPFGSGTPFVSLISHNKLSYFLDDIDMADMGIEVTAPDLAEQMHGLGSRLLDDPAPTQARTAAARDRLWEISATNVADMGRAFGIDAPEPRP